MIVTPALRRVLPFAALAFAFFTVRPQEPKAPLPARPAPHPLEGVYELRRRVAGASVDPKPSTGWLAITRGHLFVSLTASGDDPDRPLLRSGVRTWTLEDDVLRTTIRCGWYTDGDGEVHLEQAGTDERRRIEQLRGLVRLYQGENTFLEFERIE